LEIFPAALDHVAHDDHRMAMALEHAAATHAQQVAPAARDRVEQQGSKPDILRLGYPHALILWHCVDRDLGLDAARAQDKRSRHRDEFLVVSRGFAACSTPGWLFIASDNASI